jgi:MFS family permease
MAGTEAAETAEVPDVGADSMAVGSVGRRVYRRLVRGRTVDFLTGKSSTIEAIRSAPPNFKMLLAGSSISMLCSRISTIAFPMLVLGLNNSPFVAGLVTCAAILPSMIAYLPAGVLVDRLNPWRVMLVSEVMRGLSITAVLILLGFDSKVKIYWLVFFMIIEEILEIFWLLADRRYMSQLMEGDKIASGQASVEVRAHAAVLAGRPIGPFLFTITPYLPFGADAISFVVSVWTLLVVGRFPGRARKGSRPGRAAGKSLGSVPSQLRREVGEGFGWLTRNRRVGGTQILMAFTTLTAQALIMMFLAEAHDKELSTVAIGAVLAASGAGGAVGSVVAGRLPGWIRKYWLRIQMCAWSVALGMLALTGVQFSWFIAVVMLVLGLTGSIGNIEFGTFLVKTLREKDEEHLLGRITSIGQVLVIGACGLGPFLGGGAIQKFGIQVAVGIFFCLVLIVTESSFFVPRISDLSVEERDSESAEAVLADSATLEDPESGVLDAAVTDRSGSFSAISNSRPLAMIDK